MIECKRTLMSPNFTFMCAESQNIENVVRSAVRDISMNLTFHTKHFILVLNFQLTLELIY